MNIDEYFLKIEKKAFMQTRPQPIIHSKRKKKVKQPVMAKKETKFKRLYLAYLESEEWAAVKLDLYQIRGRKCELCGSKKKIQVHHLTYKNLFHEEPEDLILLCRQCHEKEHQDKSSAG